MAATCKPRNKLLLTLHALRLEIKGEAQRSCSVFWIPSQMEENGVEEVISRTRKGDRHSLSLEPEASRYTDRGIGQLPS